MDLSEINNTNDKRHPWEIVRAKILRKILAYGNEQCEIDRVLDIGCGDGFTIEQVCQDLGPITVDAVDTNLSKAQIDSFSGSSSCINFHATYDLLPHKSYQLITLFDVLEHVDDDILFLTNIVKDFATVPQAKIFITVPAFNWLYSNHDVALRHHRRYDSEMMCQLASQSGLQIIEYGFLFSGLLPFRFASHLWESLTPNKKRSVQGVGQWHHGQKFTKLIETILFLDCLLALKANKCGIKIPGLTLWSLCEPLR